MPESKLPTERAEREAGDLHAVLRRARAGDASALPALRKVLDTGGLVESLGNLALQIEATLIENAAGDNLAFKEGLGYKMRRLRAELAGSDSPPLERLLADRITVCWLALHDAEVRLAQSQDLTINQADHWQRRIDSAHKRYLSGAGDSRVRVPAEPRPDHHRGAAAVATAPEGRADRQHVPLVGQRTHWCGRTPDSFPEPTGYFGDILEGRPAGVGRKPKYRNQ